MNTSMTEIALLEVLRSVLERIPALSSVRFVPGTTEAGEPVDAIAEVVLSGAAASQWVIEVASAPLEPRSARVLAAKLAEAREATGASYAVVIAPFVSQRSDEILQKAGVGSCDLSGNCRLVHGTLLVERTGFPNAFASKRRQRSLFSPAAERVLRALLDPENLGTAWTIRDLADAAYPGVSVGQAHRVVRRLEEEGFLRRDEDGLRIRDPKQLLREWTKAYDIRRHRTFRFYSPLRVPELRSAFEELVHSGHSGLLASFSAADLLAPFVRQHRFFVYWLDNHDVLEERLRLTPTDSGDNVVVYEPYDRGVLCGADGLTTSPVQTYLDLRASPGRGEDAAEAMYDKHLRKAYGE